MSILSPNTLEFFSHSPEQTRRVGIRLGSLLQARPVVGWVERSRAVISNFLFGAQPNTPQMVGNGQQVCYW